MKSQYRRRPLPASVTVEKWIIIASLLIFVAGCGGKRTAEETQEVQEPQEPTPLSQQEIENIIAGLKNFPDMPVEQDEVAVIETDMGRIVFSFYSDAAPVHAANFKKLAQAGYFDGTTFHRVIPGFMIQGGDILSRDDIPRNDGSGGPGYTLPAEIEKTHIRGAVAAARKGAGNPQKRSSGSQFYICVQEVPHLDGDYTVFGIVVDGMEVVERIVAVPRDRRDRPIKDTVMRKIRLIPRAKL